MDNWGNRVFAMRSSKDPARQGPRLRHIFASLLLSSGEPLKYVCSQLGHPSIRMTADVYGNRSGNQWQPNATKQRKAARWRPNSFRFSGPEGVRTPGPHDCQFPWKPSWIRVSAAYGAQDSAKPRKKIEIPHPGRTRIR